MFVRVYKDKESWMLEHVYLVLLCQPKQKKKIEVHDDERLFLNNSPMAGPGRAEPAGTLNRTDLTSDIIIKKITGLIPN